MNHYDPQNSGRDRIAEHSYSQTNTNFNVSPSKNNGSSILSNRDQQDKRPQTQTVQTLDSNEMIGGENNIDDKGYAKVEGVPKNGESIKITEDNQFQKELRSEQMNDGSVLAISNYVESGIVGSQLDNQSLQRTLETGERSNFQQKRKSLRVGAHTLSNQFDNQEDSAFLANKRSTLMHSRDKYSVSSFNPHMMRGSLNCGYRKHEMIRINQGNKVSINYYS